MAGIGRDGEKNILKSYEWTNLLFFLFVILALGGFVSLVFHSYSKPEQPKWSPPRNILSEVVVPGSDTCIFYLGKELPPPHGKYESREQVPATDDGFLLGFFKIEGVAGVEVGPKSIVIRINPSARWEAVLPQAREIINVRLQSHD